MILKVDDLSKVFNTPKGSTAALNDINFETHRREFFAWSGRRAAASRRWCAFSPGSSSTVPAKFCSTASR